MSSNAGCAVLHVNLLKRKHKGGKTTTVEVNSMPLGREVRIKPAVHCLLMRASAEIDRLTGPESGLFRTYNGARLCFVVVHATALHVQAILWLPSLDLIDGLIPALCVDGFTFHSPQGFDLVRKILLEALPTFEPHSYQMDGICKVLDKIDLVAVTPTGSGKTGFLFLTILVMIAIAANPSLEDLWIKAREGTSMLILGPEQLISKGFQDLLKFEPFYDRVCALGVDEIHLLSLWGLAFRKAFMQIGFMRARFRPGIPIIGLTATLLSDPKISDAIFDFLGVNRGEFYLLHRSNARHDIQILFRTLYSGIDGLYFPELAWVI
ncbi:hypothetical protein B0H10DRAFT_2186220 [Mycena sp. CBHHK59/15]|nr:hypothetical protein B0H10DRAFT_2186220 [Mycena sp. CBHHK59/15]